MEGGWCFGQGLLSPEVATEGLPSLPPAPLPGAALGEAIHPLKPLRGSAREKRQCLCRHMPATCDGTKAVREDGPTCLELPHALCANPCFHTLSGVFYVTNNRIQLKGQFLKPEMSLPAHTCTFLGQGSKWRERETTWG